MFCRKCGTKLNAEAEFCHKCGTKVYRFDEQSDKNETDPQLNTIKFVGTTSYEGETISDFEEQSEKGELQNDSNPTVKSDEFDGLDIKSSKPKRDITPIILIVIIVISVSAIPLGIMWKNGAFGSGNLSSDNLGGDKSVISSDKNNSSSEQYSNDIGKTKTFNRDNWGNLEVTLNSVDYRNRYNDYVPSNGFVYLCANFTVKNLGSTNGALPSGWNKITYDGQYEFIGTYMGEDTTLKPMSPPKAITLVFEVPNEAKTSGKPLVLSLNDVDNSRIISFAFRGGSNNVSQSNVADDTFFYEDACFYLDRDESRYTQITLYRDGTFDMNVNLYAGGGTIWGTYIADDNGIHCYVSSRNFDGFTGSDVTEFDFSYSYERLLYHGEMIGMVGEGAYFSPVE